MAPPGRHFCFARHKIARPPKIFRSHPKIACPKLSMCGHRLEAHSGKRRAGMGETPGNGSERETAQMQARDDVSAWFVREVLPLEAILMQFLHHNWRNAS